VSKIRIGIVGCGEVTQIIHLPALRHLSDHFSIVALCDISPVVLAGVAEQCGTVKTYSDHRDLVRDPDVDAVLVANPHAYHAQVALAALESGKNVFLEKPMCLTLSEADDLAEAERRTGRTVQIGYMRRYAGAFLEARDLVRAEQGRIRFARIQDIIGENALIVSDTSAVIRDPDLPQSTKADLKELSERKAQEAIGVASEDLIRSYDVLLGLASHDISALRELVGRPLSVLHASHRWEGRFITATFDYGTFVCEMVIGLDHLPRYDTFIEIYGEKTTIRLDYDTPYVRNVPARLTVTSPHGAAGVSRNVSFPSRLDSFVVEWQAFHNSILTGARAKTTVADAREDLEIFLEIVERIKDDSRARQHA
jgi:predicted dehydrogenase